MEEIGMKSIDWNSIFNYHDGKLIWKIKCSNSQNIGDIAGSERCTSKGYKSWQFQYKGKQWNASRVIYEMFNGPLSIEQTVDHKDRDSLNTRIENLRVATCREQQQNRGIGLNNTSGYKGVCFDKQSGKWSAKIKIDRKTKHIGYFSEIKDAALAYNRKALELFGEFAYINEIKQDANEVA